jgi:plastocyanin
MNQIANDHCLPDAPVLKEETVVVGANGGLKNVLVSIEGLGAMDGSSLPPARLDQVDCRYVPHVLGLCAGQTLRVTSSDPTLHNVQFAGTLNRAQNFGMTHAGATRDVTTLTRPEVVPVRCDVHPWMLAYVVVTENPFFAVTGDGGTFEIKDLPPGDYKLVAWHERYGRLEQSLSVTDEKPLDVKFDYKQQ